MSAQLSIFLNSYAFMIMGAIMTCVGMSMGLPRRHSVGVFVTYMLIKGFLWSLYDVSFMLDTMGTPEYLFQMVGTPTLAVLSYIALYYTWKGEFFRVGLVGFAVDIIMGAAMFPAYLLTDQLFGQPVAFDYRDYLGMSSAVRCLMVAGCILLFLNVARPLFRWLGAHEFSHTNIWQAGVIACVVVATLPRMTTTMQVARPVYAATAIGFLLAASLMGYVFVRLRSERKRQALLEQETRLAANYAQSIREQLANLDEGSAQLDAIAAEIARLQQNAPPKDGEGSSGNNDDGNGGNGESDGEDSPLAAHVQRLRDLCESLRYGTYSDYPALDAALAAFKDEFECAGLKVEYRIPPLDDAAARATLVTQALLTWALEAYGDCGLATPPVGKTNVSSETETKASAISPDISLRIVRSGNQIAFALDAPSNKKKQFPRQLLEERVVPFEGVVLQTDDGKRKGVHALVTEA